MGLFPFEIRNKNSYLLLFEVFTIHFNGLQCVDSTPSTRNKGCFRVWERRKSCKNRTSGIIDRNDDSTEIHKPFSVVERPS